MAFELSLRAAAGLFVVSSLALVGVSTVITGCSSDDNNGGTEDAGPAQCPATLAAAAGSACTVERMGCPYLYDCGQFLGQSAQCTCTDKVWSCVDPANNPVAAGATPSCTSPGGGNDKDCPAAETEGAVCHTTGLVCSYTGKTCEGSATPLTDQCQCVPNGDAGSSGFHIHCEPAQCLTPPAGDGGGGDTDAGDGG